MENMKQKLISRGKVDSDKLNDSLLVFSKLIRLLDFQRIINDEAKHETFKLARDAYHKTFLLYTKAWNTRDALMNYITEEDVLARFVSDALDYAMQHAKVLTDDFDMF